MLLMDGMYAEIPTRNPEISLYFSLFTGISAETGSLVTASTAILI
jgi:hypothetical protein